MSTLSNKERIVIFPFNVWKKAKKKEDLADWLSSYSTAEEPDPLLELEDYLYLPKGKVQIEIRLYANGEILATLPNTDLAAEGNTVKEAKDNLKADIEDDYTYLKKRRNTLGEPLRSQLSLLEGFF